MPSPSRKYSKRKSPSPGSGQRKAPPEQLANNNNDDNDGDGGVAASSSRRLKKMNNPKKNDPSLVGKRTGVTVPPRGQIPLNENGMEDADAFFAAAKSPTSPSSGSHSHGNASPSPSKAYGKRAKEARERERREEERRRKREEIEEEGRRNATKNPEILNSKGGDDGENASDNDEEDNGKGKKRVSYQPTPKQPNWSNRLLHQAMGVPTEDSPQYTVLSKVSTAAPSTHRSIDTIATESRHALRGKQSGMQLDRIAQHDDASPEGGGRNKDASMTQDSSIAELEDDGPMDPPEEMSQESSSGEQKRGVDPVEREDVLEPEGAGEEDMDLEEESANVDDNDVSAKQSAKSAASAKTAASSKTDALENSLEEVLESNQDYGDDYADDDDGGDIGSGAIQFATQPEEEEDEVGEEEVDFGGANDGGGFDDDDDDLVENNAEAMSHSASAKSRGSNASSKDSKMSASAKSRMSASAKSQISEQQQPPEDNESEEEESPPKKKKAKKQQSVTTPISVLRTSKKSKKKKNQTSNRVNFSTPTGNARGMPAGNREYEAVPVSDYKDHGEEPKTPGGSRLRRSRRAKFKPLQFWKNEKLIYTAQNEKGALGEAMGDMPVVSGVMHALPTPYKEVKRREQPAKKKAKKRGRGSDSDDSDDDDTTVAKMPFDDKALRKKHRIRNGESGSVWSETLESATDIKIVSRIDNRTFSKLPLSSTRKKRESKVVGFASQAFHVPTDDDDLFPGYIAGNVVLPPRGIKDAEGVGLCSQVFNVGDCQPNSLEFALADPSGDDGEFDPKTAQRYLLSKGDMFQIPPGNVYRIENHSKVMKASLFWTIIKCTSRAEQEDEEEEESEVEEEEQGK